MRVRLLGPVDVEVDGCAVPIHGARRRAALAALALHTGQIVSVNHLLDAVWGDRVPPTAANTLQSHLSHLRRVLGDRNAIVARPPGYLLTADTDVLAAGALAEQARTAPDQVTRAGLLRSALALWRGRPLEDAGAQPYLAEQAERLADLRARLNRELVEVRLELGEAATLVPELEELSAERPYDEQLHAQLMLALYRCGRQADALAAYQRLQRRLREELGIDPGSVVRDREVAILRQDPALDRRPAVSIAAVPARTPRQLPPALAVFAGRDAELAALDRMLEAGTGPAVVISAVSGMPGVGKTALAVHWAHRVAGRFPDGQLYANLRGFDPTARPLEPTEVLRGFLDGLGTPPERIPAELAAQVALYRSLLAGRRMLVLLDNAADAAQIRPLLAGAAGCLVLITSRSPLQPLVAAEGARTLPLGLLDDHRAIEVLGRRLGPDRIDAEPRAAARLVARCGRLPLALAVVAARVARHPAFPLEAIADTLDATVAGLDGLDGGDPATSVRAVFSWSYRDLTAPAARLFRLLGTHPAAGMSVAAAAGLAGTTAGQARRLLTDLADANLVTEVAPGRYGCHDLLREYATELSAELDPPAEREAALARMLEYYLNAAAGAAHALYPNQRRDGLIPAGVPVAGDPTDWFGVEMPVLLRCLDLAAESGQEAYTWQLAWSLVAALDGQGRWADVIYTQELGLTAALRLGERAAQEEAHRRLAWAYIGINQSSRARMHAETAVRLATALGEPAARAGAERALAEWYRSQDDNQTALEHDLTALALCEQAGVSMVGALNSVGWDYAQLGEYEQALLHCTRALELYQEQNPGSDPPYILDSLGFVHHRLGNHAAAIRWYERAARAFEASPDSHAHADGLVALGDVYAASGQQAQARTVWQQALALYTVLNHPDAAQVYDRLGEHRAAIRLVR